MQYGVCADPRDAAVLQAAGFEFIELHVQNHLKTMEDQAAYLEELARIEAAPLPALAANCFVPGSLKLTGPDVDWTALKGYVETGFQRAHQAGIQTIVFGSGGARRIPDGFDRDRAWDQLVRFGKLIGPLAAEQKVTVVVEPLNRAKGACNVLTSVGESARYVDDVAHPNVRLLVDSYHLMLDDDSLDDVVANGHLLHHVHVATLDNRLPPGLESCDFSDFFRALTLSGYDGPISIEARWDDIDAQASKAYESLVRMVEDQAAGAARS